MPLSPSQRLASIDDLLLYRLSRLSSVAGAMVVRLCEGGYGITRRERAVVAQLDEVWMPQIQAIHSQILKALQPEEAAQFDEALVRLQSHAQSWLTELSPDLPKANRRQAQQGKGAA